MFSSQIRAHRVARDSDSPLEASLPLFPSSLKIPPSCVRCQGTEKDGELRERINRVSTACSLAHAVLEVHLARANSSPILSTRSIWHQRSGTGRFVSDRASADFGFPRSDSHSVFVQASHTLCETHRALAIQPRLPVSGSRSKKIPPICFGHRQRSMRRQRRRDQSIPSLNAPRLCQKMARSHENRASSKRLGSGKRFLKKRFFSTFPSHILCRGHSGVVSARPFLNGTFWPKRHVLLPLSHMMSK